MTYEYDVGIALGGSNIEERMHPVAAAYIREEIPIVIFVGRWQAKQAINYFQSWGIPPFSEDSRKGYIVSKDDSATTKQNAFIARRIIEHYSLGNRILISTEFHHGKRALKDFSWFFPEPQYTLDLVTVGGTIKSKKEFVLRYFHEPLSTAFDLFYQDLKIPAITLEDAFKLYSRDKVLQPVLDQLREYESQMMTM